MFFVVCSLRKFVSIEAYKKLDELELEWLERDLSRFIVPNSKFDVCMPGNSESTIEVLSQNILSIVIILSISVSLLFYASL